MWEKWDAIKPDGTVQAISYNHYSYGSVGNWLYTNVAGIKAVSPGYDKFIIKPVPGGGLSWVKASFKSVHGLIMANWKIRNGVFHLQVVIPPGTKAEVFLPHKPGINAGPGCHHYFSKM